MKILSRNSVIKLRDEFNQKPYLVETPYDQLVRELGLTTIERYSLDTSIQLEMPTGHNTIQELKDKTNCILIYQALPNLKSADATDESLWVTLCLSTYRDYFQTRWKKNKLSHIFAASHQWRERTRNQTISRLWWTMHFAVRLDSKNPYKWLDILLDQADLRSSILERNSSANSRNVFRSILEIIMEFEQQGTKYQKDKFRDFMKSVNLLGKKILLPSLSIDEIKNLLRTRYLEAYK